MTDRAMPWFRMYTDFLNDPKMIKLSFEDQRHFIGVLALKSGKVLDQECDEKTLNRIVAQRLWIDFAIIEDVKARLLGAALIDDRWQPLAWDKRQRRSDADPTGADRQRQFRERNASRNAPITPPEESRGEDTEGDKSPSAYSTDFERAWSLYPKRPNNSKAAAWRAWQARIRAGVNPEDMIAGVVRYQVWARESGKAGTEFVKQAATFFGPNNHYAEEWKVVRVESNRQSHRTSWAAGNQGGQHVGADSFIDV